MQTNLFEPLALPDILRQPKAPDFDGSDYDPDKDQARLTGQILRVFEVMQDHQWRTVNEIHDRIQTRYQCADPVCSISAQLRHLRKPKFGGYHIEKRRRGHDASALWEYRLAGEA